MAHAKRKVTRAAVVSLFVILLMTTGGFITSVAAQSVDDIQTTLTDEDGDGLEDRIEIQMTVSDVETGLTLVELEGNGFDLNVSPTDAEDGGQAQFVTLTEEENTVEFVEVGTADSTYTVVADLSSQSSGDAGSVVVWVGSETRADANDEMSSQFEVGGNDTDQDGESDEGGNAGETVDGNDTGGESDGTDSTDNSGGEGLPGFTTTVSLLALILTAVYHRSRDG